MFWTCQRSSRLDLNQDRLITNGTIPSKFRSESAFLTTFLLKIPTCHNTTP
jgi:hypothetical protein